jgi:hypothetical protein
MLSVRYILSPGLRVDRFIEPWMSFTELMSLFDDALLGKLFEDSLLRFQAFGLSVVHDVI